uniref:Protein FAR1-RELATED SEQUENCE 7 n=1 Tax=Anthurium amnicola TaxID=1678845 RepID=A0A1D1XJE0_9ARAE
MSSSMEADLLDSEMGLEYDPHYSDFEDEGLEEGSEEEEEDEVMDGPLITTGKDGEMIESYDRRELISNEVGTYSEPMVGMEFDSEESARAFYTSYARHAGFRVRVSKGRRSMNDGAVVCRQFLCSREGFYEDTNQGEDRDQEMIAGVGCMARLVVKKHDSGRWVVTKFEREHNHDPMDPIAMRRVDLKPLQASDVNNVMNSIHKAESPSEKGLAFVPPRGSRELEPHEGMKFPSEEAARAFYYTYAKDLGFTVRISKCRRARDGSIICRRFVCSKEGYYVRKYGRTKRSRALTRVGCLARLIVKKLDSGLWEVANFEMEHNHPPFAMGAELSFEPPKPTRRIKRASHLALEGPTGSVVAKSETDMQNSQSPVTWRFDKLHQEGIKFAEEGSSSVEIFNVAMFALREATQKVIAAKNNVPNVPQIGNGDQADWSSDSGKQVTPSNQQTSSEVCVQKHTLTTGQRLDDNGSVSSSMTVGRKRRPQSREDGVDHFDGNASQDQGWNIIAGSNTGSSGNSTNLALSEAQVAALQAVAEAFSVPTMGATSSSALPVKVSPVSGEIDGDRRYAEFQEAPRVPGPNPLVHAAAIAAGARIASPEVAASLIKAVQSRTAVHFKSGSSIPKLSVRLGEPFSAKSPTPQQQSNVHYIRTEEPPLSPVTVGVSPHVGVPGSQDVFVAGESSDMRAAMDEQMNARAMAELEEAAHDNLMQHHHMAGLQQHNRSVMG